MSTIFNCMNSGQVIKSFMLIVTNCAPLVEIMLLTKMLVVSMSAVGVPQSPGSWFCCHQWWGIFDVGLLFWSKFAQMWPYVTFSAVCRDMLLWDKYNGVIPWTLLGTPCAMWPSSFQWAFFQMVQYVGFLWDVCILWAHLFHHLDDTKDFCWEFSGCGVLGCECWIVELE